jgi:glycosyltransferase involved in cell wall biosynthesis
VTADRQPILTICIPTYRRPDLLARALRSIEASDVERRADIEILVSDNAPDVGAPIANPWLATWGGPTRYIANETDIGSVPNINQCVAEARGRFVLLLPDDDYLLPDALARIMSVITYARAARCFLFGVLIVDSKQRTLSWQGALNMERLSGRQALRRVLTNSSMVRIPALVLDRAAVLEVGGFDESLGGPTDFDLVAKLFGQYGLTTVPETISAYSVHEAALTTSMFREETIAVLMTIFDRAVTTKVMSERAVRRCQVEWFHQFVLGGAYRRIRIGDTAEARRIMRLLDLPSIRQLGRSRRWRPIRFILAFLVWLPPAVARYMLSSARLLGLEQRIWMAL